MPAQTQFYASQQPQSDLEPQALAAVYLGPNAQSTQPAAMMLDPPPGQLTPVTAVSASAVPAAQSWDRSAPSTSDSGVNGVSPASASVHHSNNQNTSANALSRPAMTLPAALTAVPPTYEPPSAAILSQVRVKIPYPLQVLLRVVMLRNYLTETGTSPSTSTQSLRDRIAPAGATAAPLADVSQKPSQSQSVVHNQLRVIIAKTVILKGPRPSDRERYDRDRDHRLDRERDIRDMRAKDPRDRSPLRAVAGDRYVPDRDRYTGLDNRDRDRELERERERDRYTPLPLAPPPSGGDRDRERERDRFCLPRLRVRRRRTETEIENGRGREREKESGERDRFVLADRERERERNRSAYPPPPPPPAQPAVGERRYTYDDRDREREREREREPERRAEYSRPPPPPSDWDDRDRDRDRRYAPAAPVAAPASYERERSLNASIARPASAAGTMRDSWPPPPSTTMDYDRDRRVERNGGWEARRTPPPPAHGPPHHSHNTNPVHTQPTHAPLPMHPPSHPLAPHPVGVSAVAASSIHAAQAPLANPTPRYRVRPRSLSPPRGGGGGGSGSLGPPPAKRARGEEYPAPATAGGPPPREEYYRPPPDSSLGARILDPPRPLGRDEPRDARGLPPPPARDVRDVRDGRSASISLSAPRDAPLSAPLNAIRDSRDVRTPAPRDGPPPSAPDAPPLRDTRDLRDAPPLRDTRDLRDALPPRDTREQRGLPPPRDTRDLRDAPPLRDSRDFRAPPPTEPSHRDAAPTPSPLPPRDLRDSRGNPMSSPLPPTPLSAPPRDSRPVSITPVSRDVRDVPMRDARPPPPPALAPAPRSDLSMRDRDRDSPRRPPPLPLPATGTGYYERPEPRLEPRNDLRERDVSRERERDRERERERDRDVHMRDVRGDPRDAVMGVRERDPRDAVPMRDPRDAHAVPMRDPREHVAPLPRGTPLDYPPLHAHSRTPPPYSGGGRASYVRDDRDHLEALKNSRKLLLLNIQTFPMIYAISLEAIEFSRGKPIIAVYVTMSAEPVQAPDVEAAPQWAVDMLHNQSWRMYVTQISIHNGDQHIKDQFRNIRFTARMLNASAPPKPARTFGAFACPSGTHPYASPFPLSHRPPLLVPHLICHRPTSRPSQVSLDSNIMNGSQRQFKTFVPSRLKNWRCCSRRTATVFLKETSLNSGKSLRILLVSTLTTSRFYRLRCSGCFEDSKTM
ncbi:hypothetical protein R3P38DRAFT_3342371 [Favolaschia claudopus]|uniref:Uncharacterized protein n=1 Tax=Favolaschia claudopus TaxID=2862362 RepID=A0AAW0DV92_9AGAR